MWEGTGQHLAPRAVFLGLVSEAVTRWGRNPTSYPGTHLHRVMSVRQGLASVARENVIGAAGAGGFCQVCLDASFEGVGARSQTTPLEHSNVTVSGREPRG